MNTDKQILCEQGGSKFLRTWSQYHLLLNSEGGEDTDSTYLL